MVVLEVDQGGVYVFLVLCFFLGGGLNVVDIEYLYNLI